MYKYKARKGTFHFQCKLTALLFLTHLGSSETAAPSRRQHSSEERGEKADSLRWDFFI